MTWDELTPRQREMMRMLATGSSNQEIADALGISPSTVRNTFAMIYRMNGLHNRVQAMRWVLGQQSGVLEIVMTA